MKTYKIPEVLTKMNQIFSKNGFKAYLVGGAVRDMLMGKEAHDWDITTDATPDQIMSIFRKVIPTGINHGTVTVHFLNHEIEVTTFRIEEGYSDGRHPDKVSFTSSLTEDLSRRDFTMNAIALSLEDGHLEDPFEGQKDIQKKIIRTVGNPIDRFTEDGLRPVRAIRFSSQLNFKINEDTLKAISNEKVLEKIKGISLERFRDELIKILSTNTPSVALKLMEKAGILNIFIPEFSVCRNCIQGNFRNFHEFDVLDHLFYACDGASKNNLTVRLAALFHDIGKPASKKIVQEAGQEKFTFYNHDKVSAQIARKVLFRIKIPNNQIDKICHLIENHMFFYESGWSDAAVRRFLVRVGYENLDDLFDLRLSDVYGMHRKSLRVHDSPTFQNLIELKERIEKIRSENSALSLKDLKINGNTLISMGITGKDIGFILKNLFETVLDDPSQNEEETLKEIAIRLYEEMNKLKN